MPLSDRTKRRTMSDPWVYAFAWGLLWGVLAGASSVALVVLAVAL